MKTDVVPPCEKRKLEKTCANYKSDRNALAQHNRRNRIVISGTLGSVSKDRLEQLVISILADIGIYAVGSHITAGHRFAKLDKQKFQKTIVHFVNRKNCKKVLFNKRLAVLTAVNMTLQKIEKPLQMRI